MIIANAQRHTRLNRDRSLKVVVQSGIQYTGIYSYSNSPLVDQANKHRKQLAAIEILILYFGLFFCGLITGLILLKGIIWYSLFDIEGIFS